jgi:CRP-like cAMP-binding protein
MYEYRKDKRSVREVSIPKMKNVTASKLLPDIFRGLRLNFLREVEVRCEVHDFERGHLFFGTGEAGQGLFLLEKGAVQTFRTSCAKKLVIADLKAPAIFWRDGLRDLVPEVRIESSYRPAA